METQRKVRKPEKRITTTKPIMKLHSKIPENKNFIRQKPEKPENEIKLNKSDEQDEISVTIDIGEDDIMDPVANKPIIKTRAKKQIPNANSDNNVEKEVFKIPDQNSAPNDEFKNFSDLINFTNSPKAETKDFKLSDFSHLSPWLSDRINQPESDIRKSRLCTASTDTFELDRRHEEEIRLLKEQIVDLECHSKIKDREIETNKWIEKEMQRRLQTIGDSLLLKHQVKDLQRKADLQERLNQDLTKENTRIYDEMNIKDRKIMELQSEVNNLDKIVTTKTILQKDEDQYTLLNRIDELHGQLLETQREMKDNQQKISSLTREIEKLDNELYLKNKKIGEMTSEITKYENDFIEQGKSQFSLLESIRSKEHENDVLLQNLQRAQMYEGQLENLQDENIFLKQSLREIEDRCKDLENRQESSQEVKSLIRELQETVINRNELNEDNMSISEQLRITESMLKDKTFQEIALLKENDQLKSFIMDLEEENGLYRRFEADVNDLEAQLRESERNRNAMENQLTQLKPQMQKLQVKSLEKDHLILQLVQELKSQVGYLPTDLRKEINKNDLRYDENHDVEQFERSNYNF